jgi:hypothetical protein
MEIETAIGENYHFALHEALLVYKGRSTSFVTRHEVTQQKDLPPVLGPAQPLTVSFVDSLVRSGARQHQGRGPARERARQG